MRANVVLIGFLAALSLQGAVSAAEAAPGVKRAAKAAYAAPRNALGQPDLEGLWDSNFIFNFEATDETPALIVPEAQAKLIARKMAHGIATTFDKYLDPEAPAQMRTVDGLPLVRGQRRTRLVIAPADGKLPYTKAAREEIATEPPEPADNPEDRASSERCLVGLGQPPLTQFIYSNEMQIVQTRDDVLLRLEYGNDIRLVPFTDKHRPAIFWGRLGDSIARWEGDTLVVETVGMPDADRRRFFPMLIVPGAATVVERFTRVGPKELLYQFTVIDPKVYAAPWLAEYSWYATDQPIYEHACHEGNYSLPGILRGARREESLPKPAASGG
jgi:hypothetical protein